MKTNHRSPLLAFWLGLLLLCSSARPLRADVFGLFTYQVVGGTQVRITDYPENAVGAVTIPAQIVGLPVTSIGGYSFDYLNQLTSVTIPSSVTSIGERAFYACTGLTSVTIPASLTSIGNEAFNYCTGLTSVTLQPGLVALGGGMFSGCTGLTSVTIPASVTSIGWNPFSGCTALTSFAVTPGNTYFSSVDGSLYNASGTSILICPGGRTGGYSIPASVTSISNYAFRGCTGLTSVTIPASVTSIGRTAFSGCTGLTSVTLPASVTSIGTEAFYCCTGLTSVTIPASVTSIGDYAFYSCTEMKSAAFQGNAPANFGDLVFGSAAPEFTVYYFTNRTGFTFPTWNGYPSIGINPALWPAATWLQAQGLPYDTSLQQDPDGDGVSLRMAYALNLDPRQNLRGRLPAPVLGEGSLSISYYAAAPGITYRVETSRNLTQWTTAGVTLSALDAENQRTASVPHDAADRFLRLVVQ